METKLEIERRWLLKCLPDIKYKEIHEISQHYYNNERYRSSRVIIDDIYLNTKYFLTKKETVSPGVNKEDERSILGEHFLAGVKLANKAIFKTRYIYEYYGKKFEIDAFIFSNTNVPSLYIMEVELNDINEEVHIPAFIEHQIIMEVTGFEQFRNYNLAC